jgi:methionyl aminopeptidase
MQKGNRLSDIGHAVQSMPNPTATAWCARSSGTVSARRCTRSPRFPTGAKPASGIALKPGLVLAIEPMITEGTHEVATLGDGWTVVTADGKLAAHFEHTIALTDEVPRILTLRENDFLELDVDRYRPKEELAA